MNISLPHDMKSFVDERVVQCGYTSSSEYVRKLIRADRELLWLKERVLSAIESGYGADANEQFFADLRALAEESRNKREDS